MEIILDSGGNGGNGGSRVRLITGSAPPLPALAARELPAITHRPGSTFAAIPPLPARAHARGYNDRRWSSGGMRVGWLLGCALLDPVEITKCRNGQ